MDDHNNPYLCVQVRLDRSARPWALLAVVEEKEGTKAAYFIRTLLADTVQRVLDNYKAPDPQAKGYVSPLSAALLRLASKFSKICLSESVLATNCTVAVLDVKLEKIYTVMCGTDAHLPVVTEQNGEALKPIHSTSRELAGAHPCVYVHSHSAHCTCSRMIRSWVCAGVHMSEATFSAPAGSQHRIVLGNSSLWYVSDSLQAAYTVCHALHRCLLCDQLDRTARASMHYTAIRLGLIAILYRVKSG